MSPLALNKSEIHCMKLNKSFIYSVLPSLRTKVIRIGRCLHDASQQKIKDLISRCIDNFLAAVATRHKEKNRGTSTSASITANTVWRSGRSIFKRAARKGRTRLSDLSALCHSARSREQFSSVEIFPYARTSCRFASDRAAFVGIPANSKEARKKLGS